MFKFCAIPSPIIGFATIFMLLGVACSRDNVTTTKLPSPPVTSTTPVAPFPSPPTVPADVNLPTTQPSRTTDEQPNYYQLALQKAFSAWSTSQSAYSQADWRLAAIQWKDVILLLKALPTSSPDFAKAQSLLAQSQQQLEFAQQQATLLHHNPLIAVSPGIPATTNTLPPPAVLPPYQPVFRTPIKRLAGGTPVVDVVLNGTQRVEMILDTGASETVITQETADALGVVPVTKARANTASSKSVEFPIGYINSIAVGGAVVKHLPVAIAPDTTLEVGLLGHDFFGKYDVTIKRHIVEFRPQ